MLSSEDGDTVPLAEDNTPSDINDWSANEIWARVILRLHARCLALFPSSTALGQQFGALRETVCWHNKRPFKPQAERPRAHRKDTTPVKRTATVGPQSKKQKLSISVASGSSSRVASSVAAEKRQPRAGPRSTTRSPSRSRSRSPPVPTIKLRGDETEQSYDLCWANKDTVGGLQDASNVNHTSLSKYEIHNPTRYDDPAAFRDHVRRVMCLHTLCLDLERLVAVVNGKGVDIKSSSRWTSWSPQINKQSSFDVQFLAYTCASNGSNRFEMMEESQSGKVKRHDSQSPQPQGPLDPQVTQGSAQAVQRPSQLGQDLDSKSLG
ncbi:hypothetical protein MMC18_002587 [Xylographa bjoerkii]|nr:hypothetical protein [Xylographa bjoerkii]